MADDSQALLSPDAAKALNIDFGSKIPNSLAIGSKLYKADLADTMARRQERKSVEGQRDAATAPIEQSIQKAQGELGATLEKGAQRETMPTQKEFTPTEIQGTMGVLMALAAFSGAFSRQPLTASLNSMAGLINGVKQGDDTRFQHEAKQFDQQLKTVIEKNREYLNEFNNIVKAKELSITQKVEQLRTLNVKYDNKLGSIKADAQDVENLFKHGYHLADLTEEAEKARAKVAERAQAHADAVAARQAAAIKQTPFKGKDGKEYVQQLHPGGMMTVIDPRTGQPVDPAVSGYAPTKQDEGAKMEQGMKGPTTLTEQLAATNWVLFNKPPSGLYAMGDKVGRARFQKATDEFMQKHDLQPVDMAMLQQANAASKTALAQQTQREASVKTIQNKLIGHGDKLMELVAKGGGDTKSMDWNKAEVWARQHLNDADAVEFVNQMVLFGNEFARLASPTSNAMLPEGAREESRQTLSTGYTKEALGRVIELIKYDAKISDKAFADEKKELLHSMLGKIGEEKPNEPHEPFTDPEKEKRYQEWLKEHPNAK